ncbi:MAG: hypothetical protein ACXACU_04390 [Candidatus Hodarchaeales archaeon]|jgi:hypothetical protein
MNNPFENIKGQIMVNGRVYSAKEVIRGLLEQGISITESAEGMTIGFKQFEPVSSASQNLTQENNPFECPFVPYMSKVNSYLEDISSRLNSQEHRPSPPSNSQSSLYQKDKSNSSTFSPFNVSSIQSEKKKSSDKENFFSSGGGFLDKHQKCSSCGTALPQNAFFCNKCGNHVRSG